MLKGIVVTVDNASWVEAAGAVVSFLGAVFFVFVKLSSLVSVQTQLQQEFKEFKQESKQEFKEIKQQLAGLPVQLQHQLQWGLAQSQQQLQSGLAQSQQQLQSGLALSQSSQNATSSQLQSSIASHQRMLEAQQQLISDLLRLASKSQPEQKQQGPWWSPVR